MFNKSHLHPITVHFPIALLTYDAFYFKGSIVYDYMIKM